MFFNYGNKLDIDIDKLDIDIDIDCKKNILIESNPRIKFVWMEFVGMRPYCGS